MVTKIAATYVQSRVCIINLLQKEWKDNILPQKRNNLLKTLENSQSFHEGLKLILSFW